MIEAMVLRRRADDTLHVAVALAASSSQITPRSEGIGTVFSLSYTTATKTECAGSADKILMKLWIFIYHCFRLSSQSTL